MNLDTKTIKDFVGLVNKTEKDKATTILTGTVHKQGEKIYVQIDGSDRLTPVSTVTNVVNGNSIFHLNIVSMVFYSSLIQKS